MVDNFSNIYLEEVEITKVWVVISIESKSLDEMMTYYRFNDNQKKQVSGLWMRNMIFYGKI